MGSEPSPAATMVDVQVMPQMWPESLQALARLNRRRDPCEETVEGQLFSKEHTFADPNHFMELLDRSGSGDSHQASLAKLYEERQNNAVSLLRQEIDTLNLERLEAERRQIQIMEEMAYEPLYVGAGIESGLLSPESPPQYEGFLGDDGPGSWSSVPGSESCLSEMEGDNNNPAEYWRDRARSYSKLLADSIRREELLLQKLSEYATQGSPTSQPLEELRQQLHRFDNFLRFALRKAPVVIGHQDSDLRYRFIYNAFPTLAEEEVIGKTDMEILGGVGVAEVTDFKREVLRKGCPEKREITFNSDLFGEKTFLIAIEPVLGRAGEAMGLNYVAMDVTEQVAKRERLAHIREQVAVQKAMETELHKTIHITEETMRAKQMLATMSHEIRSPLSGVVSMAEVLATTNLDAEQRQLVDVMVSSGDLVLQLINDILDLSKVQSGAMKFEAKKFRPREVVKHVLQMALASMQKKNLVLEGRVYDDVPLEVIGDVLRIRQVFTNLVSNAIKFTHEGGVTINMRVVPSPSPPPVERAAKGAFQATNCFSLPMPGHPAAAAGAAHCAPRPKFVPLFQQDASLTPGRRSSADGDEGISRLITQQSTSMGRSGRRKLELGEEGTQETVWLHCDVCDTGIGIPEAALPTLFEKYTQVSTTHARKYGGTGLGLAICKNLVELMGGSLTVASTENQGSTFSFKLPLRVARERSLSTGQLSEEVYDIMTNEAKREGLTTEKVASTKKVGYFHFTSKVGPSSLRRSSSYSSSSSPSDSRSSSTLMANSLTCSTAESSSPEQEPQQHSIPSIDGEKAARPHEASSLGFSQDTSPEFMDIDSKAPDHMEYLPGLSMPQCQFPAPLVLKTSLEGSSCSWLPPKARSLRGPSGPGPSQKAAAGKGPERATLPPDTMRHQRPSRILLAEDNMVNVMVAQSMLKRLGHKLEVVSNGAEAIQAVQRNSYYDVILMDVCMPVMDGLEATRRIRRYEQTGSWGLPPEDVEARRDAEASADDFPPDVRFAHGPPPSLSGKRRRIPIIAMTANALADNMLECYNHGMDCFIAKPVTFTKLEQVLKQFIPCLDRTNSSQLSQLTPEDPDR